ncbi:MAG: hypothetical protein LC800_08625 [Acidobacteria bacterium]|nr:hypothetical protein [Acidobacteriota bacterium]
MRSKFYHQALVVLLAAIIGVAVANKVHETYDDLRRVSGEVGRQLTRSGYGMLSTGEALTERIRRIELDRAPQPQPRRCPRSS